MWGRFTKVIKTVFPNARIVYDRFHVMKILNEELNKIRKECGSKLKKLKTKGIRRLILKNGESLTAEEKEALVGLLCLTKKRFMQWSRFQWVLASKCNPCYKTICEPQDPKKKF
jgi:transposase